VILESVRISSRIIGIAICSFALAGLVAPLQMPAEAAGYFAPGMKAKSDHFGISPHIDGECAKTTKHLGGTGTDAGCKPDSDKIKNYIDLDRKGHKVVKKSKIRGR
jgi:hypothetical protein